MFQFGVFEFGVFVLDGFVRDAPGITQSSSVFGAFMRSVGGEFGAVGGAMLFNFFGFILGEFGFRGSLIFGGVEVRLFLSFFFFSFFVIREFGLASSVKFLSLVIFFEFGAADDGAGLDEIGGFLVFCLDEFGRKGHDLVFAQFDIVARGRGFRISGYRQLERRSFVPRWIRTMSRKGRILRNADIFVGRDGGSF